MIFLSFDFQFNPFLELCAQQNPDDSCAANACTIENHFISNTMNALMFSGTPPKLESYSHVDGFEPSANCMATVSGGLKGERQCCGNHPTRFPYSHLAGKRQCCGSTTFDPTIFDCCNDDTIASIGSC